MNIADVLARKGSAVHTIVPFATVAEAVARLGELRVGALLVSEDQQRIGGIVSERDIIRELGTQGAGLLDRTVADVMTRNVATVSPDESISYGLAQMTRGRYRHLPVVDASGVLVGLVSIGDLVGNRLREVELESGVLRDAYIASR